MHGSRARRRGPECVAERPAGRLHRGPTARLAVVRAGATTAAAGAVEAAGVCAVRGALRSGLPRRFGSFAGRGRCVGRSPPPGRRPPAVWASPGVESSAGAAMRAASPVSGVSPALGFGIRPDPFRPPLCSPLRVSPGMPGSTSDAAAVRSAAWHETGSSIMKQLPTLLGPGSYQRWPSCEATIPNENRQPQARSLARLFGGEERVEQPHSRRLWNARSVVANSDSDVFRIVDKFVRLGAAGPDGSEAQSQSPRGAQALSGREFRNACMALIRQVQGELAASGPGPGRPRQVGCGLSTNTSTRFVLRAYDCSSRTLRTSVRCSSDVARRALAGEVQQVLDDAPGSVRLLDEQAGVVLMSSGRR